MKDRIGPDERLDASDGALCFDPGGDVLEESRRPAFPRQVCWCNAHPNDPSWNTRGFDPGTQLPPRPFGQRRLIERIAAPPHPVPLGAVRGGDRDLDPMRGNPASNEQIHETMRKRAGGKPDLFDQQEWFFEPHLDSEILRNLSRYGYPILPAGKPVYRCPDVPEPRENGRPGQTSQIAESSDPQPAKHCSEVVHPECPHIEACEKRRVVGHDPSGCGQRSPSCCERPTGKAEPSTWSDRFDGCNDLGQHRLLTAVVTHRTVDGHECQPRFGDFDPRYECFDGRNDRFEDHSLGTGILCQRHPSGTEHLGLGSAHPDHGSFPHRHIVGGDDPGATVDDHT